MLHALNTDEAMNSQDLITAAEKAYQPAPGTAPESQFVRQTTLQHPVRCSGVGLHSGAPVHLTLTPADEDTGIVFIRTDVKNKNNRIKASFDNVVDTKLCTMIGNEAGVTVSTIEHLMAALWACEIDNAIIELDGPEVPIMDGSSAPFIFLIDCAGISQQDRPRKFLKINKEIQLEQNGNCGLKRISLKPAERLSISFGISFPTGAITSQAYVFYGNQAKFKAEISRARTFGFMHEIQQLQKLGLARGGSLNNAIVIDGDEILNTEGLRYNDEFVRHKILDCIGDLYLAGCPIIAEVEAIKSGHELNNHCLHELFADEDNFTEVCLEKPVTEVVE